MERYQIVFLGEKEVGKTSIISQYLEKKFSEDHKVQLKLETAQQQIDYAKSTCNDCPFMYLIGNKSDLESKRKVTYDDGLNLAKKNGLEFKEISAKEGLKEIQEIFDDITMKVYSHQNKLKELWQKKYGKEEENLYKIIFLGEQEVGKTSILKGLLDNGNQESSILKAEINNIEFKFQLIDTAEFKSLIPANLRDSQCIVIIVYDITSQNALETAQQYIDFAKSNCKDCQIMFLIGNKLDLENQRKVICDDGLNLAKKNGLEFKEISAKQESQIFEIFDEILMKVFETKEKEDIKGNTWKAWQKKLDKKEEKLNYEEEKFN